MKNFSFVIIPSVVTSVSVVLASENDTSTSTTTTTTTTSTTTAAPPIISSTLSPSLSSSSSSSKPIDEPKHLQLLEVTVPEHAAELQESSRSSGGVLLLRKVSRKEEGVQNVINTLKNIVQEEKQKLEDPKSPAASSTSSSSSTTGIPVQSADESPPTNKLVPGSTFSGEDDDEVESSNLGASGGADPAMDDFAKHVVAMQPQPDEPDNETATSAEVQLITVNYQ